MVQLDSAPALVVIDMQNGFCHKQGSFAKMGMQSDPTAIIPHINQLRSAFHAANIPVFFVRTGYNADYSDRRPHDRGDRVEKLGGLLRGSWDAEIIDELTPGPHEEIVNKTRNSAFLGTCSLEKILKEHGVNHLVLTGVGTDVCVESTARDAYQMDYRVTTVSDATGTCTEADHLAALHALRIFGGTASTAEVIEALQKLENRMPRRKERAGIESMWRAAGLPINGTVDVARIIAGVACDPDMNGKAIYVEGGRGREIEDNINRLESQWFGEEKAKSLARGQEVLGAGMDWAAKKEKGRKTKR